jgi:hypothetical protein
LRVIRAIHKAQIDHQMLCEDELPNGPEADPAKQAVLMEERALVLPSLEEAQLT